MNPEILVNTLKLGSFSELWNVYRQEVQKLRKRSVSTDTEMTDTEFY